MGFATKFRNNLPNGFRPANEPNGGFAISFSEVKDAEGWRGQLEANDKKKEYIIVDTERPSDYERTGNGNTTEYRYEIYWRERRGSLPKIDRSREEFRRSV